MILDQAPNMFVDYFNYDGESVDHSDMDMIIVDWRCYTDSPGTYWAVHQFGSGNGIDGYAGFINNGTSHRVLFSLWNDGTNYSTVEYVSGLSQLNDLTFVEGDGSGKHIFTNYNWSPNTWYTMCIGVKNVAGKTYYAQWIRRETSTRWILCGVISFPVSNMEQSKHDYYSSAKVEFPAMVDNEHFKSVKNMIVKTAAELNFDVTVRDSISPSVEIGDTNDEVSSGAGEEASKQGITEPESIADETAKAEANSDAFANAAFGLLTSLSRIITDDYDSEHRKQSYQNSNNDHKQYHSDNQQYKHKNGYALRSLGGHILFRRYYPTITI